MILVRNFLDPGWRQQGWSPYPSWAVWRDTRSRRIYLKEAVYGIGERRGLACGPWR